MIKLQKVIKMKKTFLVVFIILLNISVFSQKTSIIEDENIIIWTETRLLTWKDFKKIKNQKSADDKKAISSIGLSFIPIYNQNKTCSFEVVPYFDKKKSRTTAKRSESLLKHEQYHFNIAELLARKFREHQDTLDKENLGKNEYDLIINWYKRVYQSYQDNYDSATKHGAIIRNQKKWEKKIDIELQGLGKYKLY